LTAAILFSVSTAKCQTLVTAHGDPVTHQLFLSNGLEPEFVSTIGYTQLVGNPGKNLDYHMGASLKFAPLIFSTGAWRFNFINNLIWRMSENWKIHFGTNLYLAHHTNRAGKMNGLGSELRVTPMHFGNIWAKGLDIGWQHTFLTHFEHSKEAKDTFKDRYPAGENGIEGPRDGWYGATALRFRLGFSGSRKLGNVLRLQVGIGALLSLQKQRILLGFSHAQVPFYLESTLSFSF